MAVLTRAAFPILVLLSSRALLAQQHGPSASELAGEDSLPDIAIHAAGLTGCLASLAPMSMHRKPVFLAATMPPLTDSLFTLQADLIAQDVAAEMRTELGARGEDAPVADGKLSWYTVPTQMIVTAMQNGDMRWRARGTLADSSATRLMTRAFDTVRARGGAMIAWPDNSAADSVLIRLTLVAQSPDESDALYPHALARVKFAAFFLSVPDEASPHLADGQPPPDYPPANEAARVGGDLVLWSVVDSAGRVVPSTIHDVWPPSKPRLEGDLGRYYQAFVTSVASWERRVKFVPAKVGVCTVSAPMLFPLRFMGPGERPGFN